MHTLAEIEAAVNGLPLPEQNALSASIAARLQGSASSVPAPRRAAHSVLEIPSANAGAMLRPSLSDDDLLDEMLRDRM